MLRNKTKNCQLLCKYLLLPWWFKLIAYFISFFLIVSSIFFLLIKGFELGDLLVKKWLSSLIFSLILSAIISQPIKTIIIYLFIHITINKENNFKLPFKETETSKTKASLKFTNLQLADEPNQINETNERELLENDQDDSVKKELNKELLIRARIKRLLIFSIYLFVVYFNVFTIKNSNFYNYGKSLRQTFIDDSFRKMNTIEEFWSWSRNGLSEKLRATNWYNKKPPYGLAGYVNDLNSRIIGYAIMRQIRVKNGNQDKLFFNYSLLDFKYIFFFNKETCLSNERLNKLVHFSLCDFHLNLEEKSDFNENWSKLESNTSNSSAFRYLKEQNLESLSYISSYSTYPGRGYVYKMQGKLKYLQGNLTQLQAFNWIDRQTRAVFVEFSLYNPNINLISICTILVEFLPTGNLLKSYRFDQIDLLNFDVNTTNIIKVFLIFIYLLLNMHKIYVELKLVYLLKFKYFKRFISWVNLTCIGFSIASIFLFIFRMQYGYELMCFFRKTEGYSYKNFQHINQINQFFTLTLSLNCFISTVMILKVLRINKRVYLLIQVMSNCIKPLLLCFAFFLIAFFAFVQMNYIILNDKHYNFSNMFKSVEQSVKMLFGYLNTQNDQEAYPFYILFKFFIFKFGFFTLVCCFLVKIMSNSYINLARRNFANTNEAHPENDEKLIDEKEGAQDDHQVYEYLKEKLLKKFFHKQSHEYKEQIKMNNINDLLKIVERLSRRVEQTI
jgi:hypothetical protein